jgi:oxygen-dependent protoporphyrinogen oxidase
VRARTATGDESLASFVRRRLGREAFDRLVQPLVGGIYTADPEQLSMAATLGRFQELERQHGSLICAAWNEKTQPGERTDSGARYSMFVAPRDGLSSLVAAVAKRLPEGSIRLNAAVQSVSPTAGGGWSVKLTSDEMLASEAVILAAPAPVAAKLVAFARDTNTSEISSLHSLAGELRGIEYAGASVVVLAVRRDQIALPPTGFGFVVPAIESRQILACSFASLKFTGRAPQDEVLIRVFVGGALQPELANLPDEDLLRIVHQELVDLIGLRGEPRLTQINRWQGAMPQYHLGHLERVARIERLVTQLPGLALAGNAYRGVGIPQCIRSGEQAAERIAALFEQRSIEA